MSSVGGMLPQHKPTPQHIKHSSVDYFQYLNKEMMKIRLLNQCCQYVECKNRSIGGEVTYGIWYV